MPSGPELEIALWLIIAVLGAIGELLTGSFFLLPFAIGGVAAALAAALGMELPWVLGLFLVVSIGSLFWLRRFARRAEADAPVLQAGAGRYVDAVGRAATEIGDGAEGRVKLDGQTWRAYSVDGRRIAAGTEVRVVEVRGTALVVKAG